MFRLALFFLAIALCAAALGSFGIEVSGAVWIVFIVFLVFAIVTLSLMFDEMGGRWTR